MAVYQNEYKRIKNGIQRNKNTIDMTRYQFDVNSLKTQSLAQIQKKVTLAQIYLQYQHSKYIYFL